MKQVDDTETDGARIQKMFDALKLETGMKKAEFARVFNFPGGASMISQHISGHRPISLDAMVAYTKGFNCSVADISPTMAASLPTTAPYTEGSKQFAALIDTASRTTNGADDDSDLIAALRAFGLRLETADDTERRRVKAVFNDLVDDPANQASLLPMLKAALPAKPKSGKRRAA